VVTALAIEGEAVLLENSDEELVGNGLDRRHRITVASLRDQGQQTPEPSIRYRQFVAGLFQNFVERPFMLGRFKKSAHCILYIGARFFLSLATA